VYIEYFVISIESNSDTNYLKIKYSLLKRN
jgi:hypothetical protein